MSHRIEETRNQEDAAEVHADVYVGAFCDRDRRLILQLGPLRYDLTPMADDLAREIAKCRAMAGVAADPVPLTDADLSNGWTEVVILFGNQPFPGAVRLSHGRRIVRFGFGLGPAPSALPLYHLRDWPELARRAVAKETP